MKIRTLILAMFFLVPALLQAESFSEKKMQTIKNIIVQSRHPDPTAMKVGIEKITSIPEVYLMRLAAAPGLRIYVKTRALSLLEHYKTTKVESFLKSTISGSRNHRLLRKIAIKTYTKAFYHQRSARVQEFLNRYTQNKILGGTVKSSLNRARVNQFRKRPKNGFKGPIRNN